MMWSFSDADTKYRGKPGRAAAYHPTERRRDGHRGQRQDARLGTNNQPIEHDADCKEQRLQKLDRRIKSHGSRCTVHHWLHCVLGTDLSRKQQPSSQSRSDWDAQLISRLDFHWLGGGVAMGRHRQLRAVATLLTAFATPQKAA